MTAADPAATAVKALDLLELLSTDRAGIGLNQLSRHVGSSRSSTVRLLAALQQKGLVIRDRASGRYRLTLRILELGTALLDQLDLPELARPHLQALSQEAGETAHLGVLEGWSVIFVGKAEPLNPIRLHARVGLRAPSHCTSLGKVLTAALAPEELAQYLAEYEFGRLTEHTITSPTAFAEHLRVVRARGYATDQEEHRLGIACVGAPVFGHTGDVVAGVSISGPTFRMTADKLEGLARVVMGAAAGLSTELGWAPGRPAPATPA